MESPQLQPGEGASSAVERSSAMTWLQAAERILREEGPEMHIRELTRRVLELGMVNSSCTTSLETLLYRQTSRGSSKFVRVTGKLGWFGLKGEGGRDGRPSVVLPSEKLVAGVALPSGGDVDFEPHVFYRRKRRRWDSWSSLSSEESSSSDEEAEMGYRRKYRFIKRVAKNIIYENAAMAQHLAGIEKTITQAEAEKRFLLQKLMQFEREGRQASSAANSASKKTITATSISKPDFTPPVPPLIHISNPDQLASAPQIKKSSPSGKHSTVNPQQPILGKIPASKGLLTDILTSGVSKGLSDTPKSSTTGLSTKLSPTATLNPPPVRSLDSSMSACSSSTSDDEEDFSISPSVAAKGGGGGGGGGGKKWKSPQQQGRQKLEPSGDAGGKSKRGKVRRLHPIMMKEDGTPVFPIQIGGLKVYNLGKIISDRPAYHSERYLLPAGFESSRVYPSMKDPSRKCSYICRILDGGEAPIFEMVPEDDPENPIRASSSTACQTFVLRAINKARDKQATNSGSGPEFFGYSNPTILNLLQNMTDVKLCTKYKSTKFEEATRQVSKKGAVKAKTTKKASKSVKEQVSLSPKTFTTTATVPGSRLPSSKGNRLPSNKDQIKTTASDPSLAPILGLGLQQFGMETANLYSSSDEWSSGSELPIEG